ncbi:MAG TPA: hypothetical protein VMU68_14555, partial [Acidimicrobiales bacterium]|nr:hypothetical protein [Acidimicrobiales bacterium]
EVAENASRALNEGVRAERGDISSGDISSGDVTRVPFFRKITASTLVDDTLSRRIPPDDT